MRNRDEATSLYWCQVTYWSRREVKYDAMQKTYCKCQQRRVRQSAATSPTCYKLIRVDIHRYSSILIVLILRPSAPPRRQLKQVAMASCPTQSMSSTPVFPARPEPDSSSKSASSLTCPLLPSYQARQPDMQRLTTRSHSSIQYTERYARVIYCIFPNSKNALRISEHGPVVT